MALTPVNRQEEWYQQMINASTGNYLPTISQQDAGKVMTVENDGSWGVENVPSDLPAVSASDKDKYLHTNASTGDVEWSPAPTGLPSVSGTDKGKVLTVNNSGVWGASGNIVLEGTRSGEDVTITTSPLPSHDAFVNAYKMGRGITLVLNDVETIYLLPFEQITSENSVTFYGIGIDFDYRKRAVYIHEMNGAVNVTFTTLDRFIVTLTPTSPDYSGTMDKTVAEINAAYEAGREIVFSVDTVDGVYYCNLSDIYVSHNSENVYPSFSTNFVLSGIFLKVITGATNDGNVHDYNTEVYTLTPAT